MRNLSVVVTGRLRSATRVHHESMSATNVCFRTVTTVDILCDHRSYTPIARYVKRFSRTRLSGCVGQWMRSKISTHLPVARVHQPLASSQFSEQNSMLTRIQKISRQSLLCPLVQYLFQNRFRNRTDHSLYLAQVRSHLGQTQDDRSHL